jgi:hypothetical protein
VALVVFSQNGKTCFSNQPADIEIYSGSSLQALGKRFRRYVYVDVLVDLLITTGLFIICMNSRDPVSNYFRSVERKMQENPTFFHV